MNDRFHATPEDVERSGIADDPLVWFVLQTNPNCEGKAVHGLLERGFVAYTPYSIRWHRPAASRTNPNPKRIPKKTPLLRGYVFVAICGLQSHYTVRSVDGVKGFVMGTNGRPFQIPCAAVETFMDREDEGEFDKTRSDKPVYRPDDKLKITGGPFKGHVATMLESLEDGKLRVMLEGLFHGKMMVDDDHVEAMAA